MITPPHTQSGLRQSYNYTNDTYQHKRTALQEDDRPHVQPLYTHLASRKPIPEHTRTDTLITHVIERQRHFSNTLKIHMHTGNIEYSTMEQSKMYLNAKPNYI